VREKSAVSGNYKNTLEHRRLDAVCALKRTINGTNLFSATRMDNAQVYDRHTPAVNESCVSIYLCCIEESQKYLVTRTHRKT
jgi:hypothetical protein